MRPRRVWIRGRRGVGGEGDELAAAGFRRVQRNLASVEVNLSPGQTGEVFEPLPCVNPGENQAAPFMVADCEQGLEFREGERAAVSFDGLKNGDLGRWVIGDEAVAPSGLEQSSHDLQLVINGAGGGLGGRDVAPSG